MVPRLLSVHLNYQAYSVSILGNWYEDRSNPLNKNHSFYLERKAQEKSYQPILTNVCYFAIETSIE